MCHRHLVDPAVMDGEPSMATSDPSVYATDVAVMNSQIPVIAASTTTEPAVHPHALANRDVADDGHGTEVYRNPVWGGVEHYGTGIRPTSGHRASKAKAGCGGFEPQFYPRLPAAYFRTPG